jgi:hypothetical protein
VQINPNKERDEAYWFPYEDDDNVELLIAPLTPLIDEECSLKATKQPPIVNGRFRRQIQSPEWRQILYKRLVFQHCVKGWRAIDPSKPGLDDMNGQPILYSEEAKAAISEVHGGLLDFGFDIAVALGQISAEKVREERDTFRRAHQVSPRVAEPELPGLLGAVRGERAP